MRMSWWQQWFEGRVAGDAEALQVLLTGSAGRKRRWRSIWPTGRAPCASPPTD